MLEDNDNILPVNQDIFADRLVTDGYTHDALKFFAKKNEEYVPNIGNFIKCISNGFYSLKQKNKTFSGVGLLDVSGIISTPVDISNYLQEYNTLKETQY